MTASHSQLPSEESEEMEIAVFGDSTIDNKIWVWPGIYARYFLDKLGIYRDAAAVRVQKSDRRFNAPELSVVEHLMKMMPNCKIHDYANDGFTTKDCLLGAYKSKVFRGNNFQMFPEVFFEPLKEGAEAIQRSRFVVLSVGGNDFREFLEKTLGKESAAERQQYMRDHFEPMLNRLASNYNRIIARLRTINPAATIIVMTQYYPSASQNDYKIYPFMKELGSLVGISSELPMDIIHAIMQRTYAAIVSATPLDNLIVADVTSSLDPWDKANHVMQIEPSGEGGRKIASMLKHIMMHSMTTPPGTVCQFTPAFFSSRESKDFDLDFRPTVRQIPLGEWQPKHPHDFTDPECYDLLRQILAKRNTFAPEHALYKACDNVFHEGNTLLETSTPKERNHLKESLRLALAALQAPEDQLQLHLQRLNLNVAKHALGHANGWSKFIGALSMLVAALAVAASVLLALPTAGLSLVGASSGLLFAGGAGLFYSGRCKSLAKSLDQLADTVEKAPRLPILGH